MASAEPNLAAPITETKALMQATPQTTTATPSTASATEASTAPTSATDAAANEPAQSCGCGDTSTPAPVANDLPSASDLTAILAHRVFDAAGTSHTLHDIVAKDAPQRHLVIFVRHFFCGNCQEYLRHLAHHLPPSSLPAATRITILGNGTPSLIPSYLAATACPYDLYTDPTPSPLYQALRLQRAKAPGNKPRYVRQSMLGSIFTGIAQGLSSGANALKGGDFWQVGGEFLFVRQAGGEYAVEWGHRMKTTRDHVEVEEVRRVLGLDLAGEAGAEKEGQKPLERSRGWSSAFTELGLWKKGNAEGSRKELKGIEEKTNGHVITNGETKAEEMKANNHHETSGADNGAQKPAIAA